MGPDLAPTKLSEHPETKKPWMGRRPQTNKQLPQSPFPGYFYDGEILVLLSMCLIFLRPPPSPQSDTAYTTPLPANMGRNIYLHICVYKPISFIGQAKNPNLLHATYLQ
jgi:hypothetical protein